MRLDSEEQRALILQCIQATVPHAVHGADAKSVAQLLQLARLREAVERAEVAPPGEAPPAALPGLGQ